MEPIKKFINATIPVTACNFRCHYCYITQTGSWKQKKPDFHYTPEAIGRALTLERMGGPCMFNLCGFGETLLPKEVPEIVEKLLANGHFVTIITNGSITERIKTLTVLPSEYKERLLLKFSFQFLELKRLRLTERFFENFKMARDAGISMSLELVANDELIHCIPEIKRVCMENVGALCQVVIPRRHDDPNLTVLTELPQEEFLDCWSSFQSPLYDFKRKIWGVQRGGQFCYAGLWAFDLEMGTGLLRRCQYGDPIQNLFEHPEEPIHGEPVGKRCPIAHCYNGHAFLGFGAIPEIECGQNGYADFRNRTDADGHDWLSPRMKAFCSTRLYQSNRAWGTLRKKIWSFFHR